MSDHDDDQMAGGGDDAYEDDYADEDIHEDDAPEDDADGHGVEGMGGDGTAPDTVHAAPDVMDAQLIDSMEFAPGVNPASGPLTAASVRVTTRYLTKYERARVLGARALQISMNAPVMVPLDGETDPLEIATKVRRLCTQISSLQAKLYATSLGVQKSQTTNPTR